MAKHLKRGMDASAIKEADAKVRETVEHILADIEARKDAAVRDLSEKFDKWSPASFKLTPAEIEHAIGQVKKRDLDDIKFAQAQVRNFAQSAKRDDARSRSRDAARRRARPQEYPGEFDRLLRAGRALSDGGVGAYVDRHRACRRREAHHRLRAAVPRRAASGDRRGDAFRRRRRDFRPRRRAGGRRHGARHRDHRAGRHDRRAGQCLCRGSQAPIVRPRRHRSARRADRDAGHRRRQRRRRNLRHRSARPGRARPDIAGYSAHQFGKARARYDAGNRAAPQNPADRPRSPARPGPISARSSSATTKPRWCARPTASRRSMCR